MLEIVESRAPAACATEQRRGGVDAEEEKDRRAAGGVAKEEEERPAGGLREAQKRAAGAARPHEAPQTRTTHQTTEGAPARLLSQRPAGAAHPGIRSTQARQYAAMGGEGGAKPTPLWGIESAVTPLQILAVLIHFL